MYSCTTDLQLEKVFNFFNFKIFEVLCKQSTDKYSYIISDHPCYRFETRLLKVYILSAWIPSSNNGFTWRLSHGKNSIKTSTETSQTTPAAVELYAQHAPKNPSFAHKLLLPVKFRMH